MAELPQWLESLCARIVARVKTIDGVGAIVLGGSQARGTARPDSDVDLALGYEAEAPFSIEELDLATSELDDQHRSRLVTHFGDWGPGVNGGGWLVIEGRHVDFLYRDLSRVREVIERCREGQAEGWYQLGHPMGFQSQIYMGEIECCRALYDPDGKIAALKALTVPYPDAMRHALIAKHLFDAEFESALAETPAKRGDVVYAAGMMFCASGFMLLVLYALNRRYFVNEKMASIESERFPLVPRNFHARIRKILGGIGDSVQAAALSASEMRVLAKDLRELCVREIGEIRPSGFGLS